MSNKNINGKFNTYKINTFREILRTWCLVFHAVHGVPYCTSVSFWRWRLHNHVPFQCLSMVTVEASLKKKANKMFVLSINQWVWVPALVSRCSVSPVALTWGLKPSCLKNLLSSKAPGFEGPLAPEPSFSLTVWALDMASFRLSLFTTWAPGSESRAGRDDTVM